MSPYAHDPVDLPAVDDSTHDDRQNINDASTVTYTCTAIGGAVHGVLFRWYSDTVEITAGVSDTSTATDHAASTLTKTMTDADCGTTIKCVIIDDAATTEYTVIVYIISESGLFAC